MTESAKVEKKLDAARIEIMARHHLQTRLEDLFSNLERSSFYTKLFPEEKALSLVAIFNNGIDPDPAFSGSVIGRIYLDEEQNLALALWSIEKEKKEQTWRKEILFSGISDFEFEFFSLKKEEKIRPSFSWRTELSKTHLEVPSMIRLTIRKKEEAPLHFAFLIPSFQPITYGEKG